MAELLRTLGPWSWIVLGLVLAGLELLAPGVFLIWLGLAAVLLNDATRDTQAQPRAGGLGAGKRRE